MTMRKSLYGIVRGAGGGGNGGPDDILDLFDRTTPADDFKPLPRGNYVAVAVKGERVKAKTGTPGYTVEFKVLEGEFTGRHLWKTWYLTPAAMPYTRRELMKLGIDCKEQLVAPFPSNKIVVRLAVVVRKEHDDAPERNDVKDVKFLRVYTPEADPFAPDATPAEGGDQ